MATASKRGRPPSYTREQADKVCEYLASGMSRDEICAMDDMPSWPTLYRWSAGECSAAAADDFPTRYARARGSYLEHLAEDIVAIADDATRDVIETEDGPQVQHEIVARAKLRIDSRKWLLSKLKPHIYGDRIAQEISGPAGGAIQHQITVEMVPAVAEAGRQRVIEAQAEEEEE